MSDDLKRLILDLYDIPPEMREAVLERPSSYELHRQRAHEVHERLVAEAVRSLLPPAG